MKKMIYCLVLLFSIYSYGQLIEIPKGKNVEIDGVINSVEWSDAVNSELFGGNGIKLKYNDK